MELFSRLQHFQYENVVEGADSVERFPSSANGCSRRERSSLKQVLLICTAKEYTSMLQGERRRRPVMPDKWCVSSTSLHFAYIAFHHQRCREWTTSIGMT